ncbi:hypothetical protein ATANTOWER_013765 [Ataeniobius toweri]|uniref:Uncharacterized protein n=1 Tax=Ataeniobius toweri TaxID=208326 RepID=A0ABU7B6J0_9TELE|nr:hypothetical protein [Ataeniobius toweri]
MKYVLAAGFPAAAAGWYLQGGGPTRRSSGRLSVKADQGLVSLGYLQNFTGWFAELLCRWFIKQRWSNTVDLNQDYLHELQQTFSFLFIKHGWRAKTRGGAAAV